MTKFSADGWASMPGPEGTNGVHVRLAEHDGRLVVTDLYLHGPEVSASALRSLSISRLEAEVNAARQLPSGPASLRDVVNYAGARWAARPEQDEPTLSDLRARTPEPSEPAERTREPLSRPAGQDVAAFYRRVADAYHDHARTSRAPAKAMAAEADVPTTTAHRWVREARRRGYLPPARKGAAG